MLGIVGRTPKIPTKSHGSISYAAASLPQPCCGVRATGPLSIKQRRCHALAQRLLRANSAIHPQRASLMRVRAIFAGRLAPIAAALLALACSDVVTTEHRADRSVRPSFDAVPIAGQQLEVPAGFTVNLFAERLNGARSLALAPDGAVFVTLSESGEIVRLMDADGDGVADERTSVLSG